MQDGSVELAPRGAIVLAFRTAPARQRFGVRERIVAAEWLDGARGRGIGRLVFHPGSEDGDPATGEFALVYERDASWASWGIAPEPAGFAVWRTASGTTTGCYPTLDGALEALLRTD